MTKLVVICGATATGKSGLALALARELGTAILSADSRQVYCEFNIGTAKPTLAEQKLVPHYLIDICTPTDTMTVADYQEKAQDLIASISSSPLLLVGGTGLYIRSIVQGMKIPRVAPQLELRSQLSQIDQNQLYAMLQQVDPIATQKIHSRDTVRTLRALEVYYVTGIPISAQQGENPPDYPILQIGLDCDSEAIQLRIHQRTEQMIADGLVAEVDGLCEKYGFDLPLLNTLGYQEIKQYLTGEISLATAQELIVLHTRQFAKRQRTWFKAYPQIEWFNANDPDLFIKVLQRVKQFMDN
ncbi:tRNA (adenosine(37)-N6)-dimethylallyltransferase MiaA [Calothrix sp. FACHB-1219]|uniref:tRNA (adenosine(37)-N6)-dimethylallyltransferase MiaA n=1 Tax=unclassified Calothrix TaxID=2619626 RepID=UPI001687ACAA|nr:MULTISPECIES: tRNA (adenosine(37)-N6)-dimethylallyltransferase MiaA [unclassified Calothrix]MBD2207530.1 tRNA (adenosine(37)-N6)-dimethylallyltransferase MiaA [Calothrix sp. FACHB-168]MBD2222131.1 tRNA (adenosine(37)-N6)-dimethylallyltransferase MiaA [Calothrix sp. FACHB-1219]